LTLLIAQGAAGLLPFAEDLQCVKWSGAFEVRALSREVRLTGGAKLMKGWKRGGICPRARVSGADLLLSCDSERLHAESTGGVLNIYALRGLPWDASDEPAPTLWFAPEEVGLGGPCPGTTPAGKAECLLKAGRDDDARKQLEAALETQDRDYASLRFADLALMENRPIAAMEWLEKTGRSGDWGRLASVRQCELSGRCFQNPSRDAMFDTAGMAAPLKVEMKLRELRLLRFESSARAIARLFDAGQGTWPEKLCGSTVICFNVLKSALSSSDVESRIMALNLYASGPVSQSSPQRPMLAAAAADAATALGARQYAAAALAAATPDVLHADLAAHLRRVVSLYIAAGENARASAVLAYALDAVGPQAKKWKTGLTPVRGSVTPKATDFPTRDAELANELATAALVRAHARQTR
jgi:hypothetical protein